MESSLKKDPQETSGSAKDMRVSSSVLSLAWELGYMIAIPLVALALGGRFLDKLWGTKPFLLLAGVVIAIMTTSYMVYKKTIDIINKK